MSVTNDDAYLIGFLLVTITKKDWEQGSDKIDEIISDSVMLWSNQKEIERGVEMGGTLNELEINQITSSHNHDKENVEVLLTITYDFEELRGNWEKVKCMRVNFLTLNESHKSDFFLWKNSV